MQQKLLSIGHGTRKWDEFVSLLRKFRVKYIIDVRTLPASRFNPQYNRKALAMNLASEKMSYIFMGDELGGRPKNESVYSNGKVSYQLLRETPFFQSGLKKLRTYIEDHQAAVILCSERKPEECHRSRLIGKELLREGIEVLHIDELGEVKNQSSLEKEFKF